MKSKLAIMLIVVMLIPTIVSAAETDGGVNIDPVVEETIFSEITHTETTTDLETWDISLTSVSYTHLTLPTNREV